jgi:hypothetical protein
MDSNTPMFNLVQEHYVIVFVEKKHYITACCTDIPSYIKLQKIPSHSDVMNFGVNP